MTPWVYNNCFLNKVIDGDTISVDIDMGFHIWRKNLYLRLARIDCPEVRGPEKENGIVARAWVRETLMPFKSKPFTVTTLKRGKYRWVAEIDYDGHNLSDEIVRHGYGIYKKF